jgi:hypothetical protein
MRFAAAGRAKEETRLHTRRVTGAAQFRIAKKIGPGAVRSRRRAAAGAAASVIAGKKVCEKPK